MFRDHDDRPADDHDGDDRHDDHLVYDVHVLVDGHDYRAVDHDVRIDHAANTVNELLDNYGNPAYQFDLDPGRALD